MMPARTGPRLGPGGARPAITSTCPFAAPNNRGHEAAHGHHPWMKLIPGTHAPDQPIGGLGAAGVGAAVGFTVLKSITSVAYQALPDFTAAAEFGSEKIRPIGLP